MTKKFVPLGSFDTQSFEKGVARTFITLSCMDGVSHQASPSKFRNEDRLKLGSKDGAEDGRPIEAEPWPNAVPADYSNKKKNKTKRHKKLIELSFAPEAAQQQSD
jgi:hypothetical protein